MTIKRILGDYLDANVYILEKDNEILIVDCGAKKEQLLNIIADKKVVGILLTHGHYDHSRYCNDYANYFKCKIYANKNIKKTLSDSVANYSDDGSVIKEYSNFVFLDKDENIKIGAFSIDCYYCPGHSICSECFSIDEILFAGDVLFNGGIGRTDLKFSDRKMMYESLCKLEKLNFKEVKSGHGEDSTYLHQMKNIAIYKRFLSR